jgi:hypothetical protein
MNDLMLHGHYLFMRQYMKNARLCLLLFAITSGGCSSSTSTTAPATTNPIPIPNPVLTGSPTESGTFTLGSQTFKVVPGIVYPTYSVQYSAQAKYIYFALRSPLFLEITLLHFSAAPGDYNIDSVGSGEGVAIYNNSEYTSLHGTCHVSMFDSVNDVVSISFNVTMQSERYGSTHWLDERISDYRRRLQRRDDVC